MFSLFSQEEESDEWTLLRKPPVQGEDTDQQEHQKVQIEFKSLEEEPEAHRFIIHRDSTGSYEVVDRFHPDPDEADKAEEVSWSEGGMCVRACVDALVWLVECVCYKMCWHLSNSELHTRSVTEQLNW